jgi:concanavalin A-like lectin/glucanase superfamily protein
VGSRAYVLGQAAPAGGESSWALWVEKVSEEGYVWRFGRTATDASGNVTETASVPSEQSAELDTWVQVTGVFDAAGPDGTGQGSTHLYVNNVKQAEEGNVSFTTAMQGSGALSAGRGPAMGVTGHALPGALREMRLWTGAMTTDQVNSKVLGPDDE